jgi:predicted ATPase/DNA-binding CsgD family transcriptional regulator
MRNKRSHVTPVLFGKDDYNWSPEEEAMTPPDIGESGSVPSLAETQGSRRLHAVAPAEAEATPRPPEHTPHNLPLELSSFIGREREIAEVKRLLGDNRLVTLTGPGGCGKTRLALEVAAGVAEDFEEGAWWAWLASFSEPELVPQAVARALSVREQPGLSLTDVLTDSLGEKQLLLVLDNCEHLVEACALFAQRMLASCPRLRILATSREVLGVGGESIWRVSPLMVPDKGHPLSSVEDLGRYEAVELFVERARSKLSSFGLTSENAGAVAEVCRRLDGIPLAIELAAARANVLSAKQILRKLENPFKLLTEGERTRAVRQQTLRAALAWSHNLLGEQERKVFGRFSAFAGGWTLEAAEAVGTGEGTEEGDVLDLLSRLVDKSLVVSEASGKEGALRYRMLEPIRQYGLERLEESGEAGQVHSRHAGYYLAVAEKAEPELRGAHQQEWLERLEREHDNIRAALQWPLERGEAELGLRLSGALAGFWHMRGYLSEGRRWLERALAKGHALSAPARAKALAGAGYMARLQGDYERSVDLSEECLALSRKLGDTSGIATALYVLGWVEVLRNEPERAEALIEEAVTLRRALGDTVGLANALLALGLVAVAQRDYEWAAALHEESLMLARKAGDDFAVGTSLGLGALASLSRGDHRRTRTLCEEGFELSRRMKARNLTAIHLHISAALAGSQGRAVRSARLWGAAEALRRAIGTVLSPFECSYYEPYITATRSLLDEATWETAWAEGFTMTPEQAAEYALSEEEEEPASPAPASATTTTAPSSSYPAGLSGREAEVLKLVAEGLTNDQVAQELFISPRTVNRHLTSIYKKLGVSSRVAATRFAAEHALL